MSARGKGLCLVSEIQKIVKYGPLCIWGEGQKHINYREGEGYPEEESTDADEVCLGKGSELWKSETLTKTGIKYEKRSPIAKI